MRALLVASLLLAAAPARADHAWTVGIRTTAQHIAPEEGSEGDGTKLVGGGLQARWRFVPSWSLEIAAEGLSGELAGGAFRRESGSLTASILWHPFGPAEWDLYVLAGLGGTCDTVTLRDAHGEELEQEFDETQVHLGVGLEHLWKHWGLGVEVRAVGLARKDKDEALPGDAVPAESAAAQGSITFGYYF